MVLALWLAGCGRAGTVANGPEGFDAAASDVAVRSDGPVQADLIVPLDVMATADTPPILSADAPTATTELAEKLTQGAWTRYLGQPLIEGYTYRFAADGTYTVIVCTDHNVPERSGRWRLEQDSAGRSHLLLKPVVGDCYWLQCDSIVRFDEALDRLIVSGPPYVGEQQLLHQSCRP